MVRFGTFAKVSLLGLDKVSQVHLRLELATWTQSGEWTHAAFASDLRPLDHRIGENLGSIADFGVDHHGTLPQRDALPNPGLPDNRDGWPDLGVRADFDS